MALFVEKNFRFRKSFLTASLQVKGARSRIPEECTEEGGAEDTVTVMVHQDQGMVHQDQGIATCPLPLQSSYREAGHEMEEGSDYPLPLPSPYREGGLEMVGGSDCPLPLPSPYREQGQGLEGGSTGSQSPPLDCTGASLITSEPRHTM